MKKKFLLSCLLIIMAWLPSFAQIQEPVKFKTELKTISDTEAQIVFTGNIDADGMFIPLTFLRAVLFPLPLMWKKYKVQS